MWPWRIGPMLLWSCFCNSGPGQRRPQTWRREPYPLSPWREYAHRSPSSRRDLHWGTHGWPHTRRRACHAWRGCPSAHKCVWVGIGLEPLWYSLWQQLHQFQQCLFLVGSSPVEMAHQSHGLAQQAPVAWEHQ